MPEIQMPKLSDTMTEGTLVAWKKKKGDQVSAGEVLAEIETDKATMEWESPEDGTLTEIYVQEGGKVNVGDKIGFIRGEGEEAPKQEEPTQKKKTEAVAEKKPQAETEKPAPAEAAEKETAPPQEKDVGAAVSAARAETTQQKPQATEQKPEEARVKASPVARRVAAELGVDLSTVKGTGPDGRVTETDVRAAAKTVNCGAGATAALDVIGDEGRPGSNRSRAHSTFRDAQSHCATAGRESRPGSTLLSHDRDQCGTADGGARGIEIRGRRRGCCEDHGERFRFESRGDGCGEGAACECFIRQ